VTLRSIVPDSVGFPFSRSCWRILLNLLPELPDLTDEHNVGLIRQWENADPTFLNILRFIRICGEYPDVMQITRPGRDGVKKGISKAGELLVEMEAASPRVGQVGSRMLAMDEIPCPM
jgi:hypothetical protein